MIRNKLLWKNNKQQYGLISKGLHWLSALAVFVLFGLGYWMVDLDYYSEWYMAFALYFILLTVLASGYLITSADGKAIAVFDWFNVSAFILIAENQEDLAGEIHYYIAYTLIFMALIHGLAAIKHHFIDKDNTLKRMTK